MNGKGTIVITESMIAIGIIIIGIILLVITFNVIFSIQSRGVEDTALIAISSELRTTIERISASASDIAKAYSFPKGISLNVIINKKDFEIVYANETGRRIRTSFASDLNTERTYNFYGARNICIVNKDKEITIIQGTCSCEELEEEPCIEYEK